MGELISRLRAPRSLGSVVLRVLVPRMVVFLAAASAVLVGQGLAVNPSAALIDVAPSTVPIWSAAERASEPDCVPSADWPEGRPSSALVVQRVRDGATMRLPFLIAWNTNHDASEANDLWVLGVCP